MTTSLLIKAFTFVAIAAYTFGTALCWSTALPFFYKHLYNRSYAATLGLSLMLLSTFYTEVLAQRHQSEWQIFILLPTIVFSFINYLQKKKQYDIFAAAFHQKVASRPFSEVVVSVRNPDRQPYQLIGRDLTNNEVRLVACGRAKWELRDMQCIMYEEFGRDKVELEIQPTKQNKR